MIGIEAIQWRGDAVLGHIFNLILLPLDFWMILPKDNMDANSGANSVAPPPSYAALGEEQRAVHPFTKTPLPPPSDVGGSGIVGSYPNPANLQPVPSSSSGPSPRSPPSSLFSQSFFAADGNVPTSFNRIPPPHLSYAGFDPMFLIAHGKTLDKGFPPTAPPSNARPHPFADHDVTEHEWLGFLDAIRVAATLTKKDIQRSHLPIISIVPIVNVLSEMGVQKIMKNRKSSKIAKLLNQWNHHFFGPRKLRVIIMRGKERMAGTTETSSDGQLATAPHSMTPSAPDDNVYRLFVVPIV